MKSQMEIEVRKGDLTAQPDIDAIVNPASDRLVLVGKIGGEILRLGGEEIDRNAQAKGPVLLGEVVATGAGALPNLYIVHAAIIGTQPEALQTPKEFGSLTSGSIVGAAVLNALERADQLGLRSIAFPALGVAMAGFPVPGCASVMLDQIEAYSKLHTESLLRRVVIVAANDFEFQEFSRRVIRRMAS